jgi:hypothetical protein
VILMEGSGCRLLICYVIVAFLEQDSASHKACKKSSRFLRQLSQAMSHDKTFEFRSGIIPTFQTKIRSSRHST